MTETTGVRIVSGSRSGIRVETHAHCLFAQEKTCEEREKERYEFDRKFFVWCWWTFCGAAAIVLCWWGSRP